MQSLLESEVTQPVSRPAAVPTRRKVRRLAPARRRPHGRDERFRGPRLRPASTPAIGPAMSPAFGAGRPVASGVGPNLAGDPATRARRSTSASPWRLTDRGIAVVLVVGLMIAVAAATVVTATAFRVTGENYHVAMQLHP